MNFVWPKAMAFTFPDHFRFADNHEYAVLDSGMVRVGISAFAVDQLGDIVFVELPEVGDSLLKGDSFGSVESVKAVEDMYAPISGVVVERNESVLSSPEQLQKDPHGDGWLLLVKPSQIEEFEDLQDSASYSNKLAAN